MLLFVVEKKKDDEIIVKNVFASFALHPQSDLIGKSFGSSLDSALIFLWRTVRNQTLRND
jgi:hypothetical protein